MRLLLDTHVLLWVDSKDSRLPKEFVSAICDRNNEIFVSAVTVWEIAIKRACGKLAFVGSAAKAIGEQGFIPLSIGVDHAELAGSLPQLHRDPFDRLLVAQAQMEGLTLVTVDELILQYPVRRL